MNSAIATLIAAVSLGGLLASCAPKHDDEPPAVEIEEGSSSVVVEESVTAPAEEPAPEPERPTEYTVQAGDFLGRIARDHGCTVRQLRRANGLIGDLIHPGDRLVLPDCDAPEPEEPAIAPAEGYTIQPGDYLELIAERSGCTTNQIMTANGLRSDAIFAGQTLHIPDCSLEVTAPIAAEPDPVEAAEGSDEAPTPEADVVAEPDAEEVEPTPEPDPEPEARPEDGLYAVEAGDFLGRISSAYGCSVSELMSANHLSNDRIMVGQTLVIPDDCTGETVEVEAVERIRTGGRDTDTLYSLMRERGFDPPRRFKAMVLAIDFNADRSRVVNEQLFDYRGTSDDTDWNPASTVKLFAAIAAMRAIRDLGFSGDARVTFDGDHETTVDELVAEALGPSNNIAYDFLVTLVGYDEINGDFFSRRNGFRNTALRRAYERSRWMEMGFSSSFRTSPEIVISEGGRTHTIAEREGDLDVECSSSACTTLQDLSECMRRLMLQEQLPASESYDLPRAELLTIRRTLRSLGRSRGEEVVDALRESFPGDGVNLYHKAGFSNDWYSDTVYIYDPRRFPTQAWIVALAGYPGRDSLTEAAEMIGELIAEGYL